MKKSRIFALLFMIMILVSGCSNNSENVKIDLGKSEIYSQEDLNSASEVVLKEIKGWNSVEEVYEISYCGDKDSASQLAYCKTLKDKDYTQCAVFVSSFKTTSSAGSDGFNPSSDYDGWRWYLARTDGGRWELLSWGYA